MGPAGRRPVNRQCCKVPNSDPCLEPGLVAITKWELTTPSLERAASPAVPLVGPVSNKKLLGAPPLSLIYRETGALKRLEALGLLAGLGPQAVAKDGPYATMARP